VTAGNPGIGVSGVTVLSGTQMAATFTIGTGAGLGVSNITVTTSGGTSGAVGTAVTITGSGFGGTQGGSTVTFGSVSAGMASEWRETSITVAVSEFCGGGDGDGE